MTRRLIIVGAGGFGREVIGWAREAVLYGKAWEIGGFLDDDASALDGFEVEAPLLGGVWDYRPQAQDVFICALGKPSLRRKVWEHFTGLGAEFTQVVHREATVGRNVELGPGVVLCPRVVLTCDLKVGANTALNVAVAAGHDVRVGCHCQISSFCDLTGYVQVGDEVFMGSRASILPGKRVGDGAVVGAGSVVLCNVEPRTTVFGNPAKLLMRH